MGEKYDFSGWATKFNLKCSDGRTIRDSAFRECDGITVPMVWQHQHDSPATVLGHCKLEYRPGQGMYTYGYFNDSEMGRTGKQLVQNGDITALSIYANGLKQKGGDVLHGKIREVSLVLAGANPGAFIDMPSLEHSDEETETEATIYNEDGSIFLFHEDTDDVTKESSEESEELSHEEKEEKEEMAEKEKTVQEVFDSMTDEQKTVVYALLGEAMNGGADDDDDEDEEDEEVKHNVFDTDEMTGADTLSHDAMDVIFKDAKRLGSMKDAVLEHAEDFGIDGIEWLFPEDHDLNNTPAWIKRDTGWVSVVMNGVSHTPFSRVRSRFANITEDEARAKGYIKGKKKKEEVFSLLKRSTTPQTIYKKQKLDRDDVIDITDFDVVAWIKGEMRMMLDEEIARAILIGDGRLASDDDKISEDHIRPIVNDADLFTIKAAVVTANGADDATKAKAFIRAAIKARKNYKGSGNPTLFTTEDMLTEMLLLEDNMGRPLYDSESALATKLRVSRIVTVEVMEGFKVQNVDPLMGIIVNLKDYTVGADKGGAISMFEDFDIDYNQQKYLIETRCSGALTIPYSAIILTDGARQGTSVDGDVLISKTQQSQDSESDGE
jgi:HK97 family phage major capsid protein